MKLGTYGQELLNKYSSILKISLKDAKEICTINKTANVFLTSESGLRLLSYEYNKEYLLSTLLRCTLLRGINDFNPLKDEEKDLIKKYYNLNIEGDYVE